MRTIRLKTLGTTLAAVALLGAVVLTSAAAHADEKDVVVDQIFSARLEAGYGGWSVDDSRAYLFPYDPLESSPVFGFDLLYLKPAFGTLDLKSGYRGEDDWEANLQYNHAADAAVEAGVRKFSHAREHAGLIPTINVPAPGYDPIEIESHDKDPGAEYRDTRQETHAALRLRAPAYPAHLRMSGRVNVHKGETQMLTFFRSCGTHFCHVNSSTRDIDQVTKEYLIGLDAHAGPVDIAYTRTHLTFEDRAGDPVDDFPDAAGILMNYPPTGAFNPPGRYVHDVNPDVKSFRDTVRLNSNLTNRAAFSLSYERSEAESDYEYLTGGAVKPLDITRGTQTLSARLSYTVSPAVLLGVRYGYDREKTLGLSNDAQNLRELNNKYHASSRFAHQHAVRPEMSAHSGELSLRWTPGARAALDAHLRHRVIEREAVYESEGTGYDTDPWKTRSTLAHVSGTYRVAQGLDLEAGLGGEWTADPAYATDSTDLLRYSLGATWSPAPILTVYAAYQGYRGTNDDSDSLQRGFEGPEITADLERTTDGNAVTLLATLLPAPSVNLTASYTLNDSGVEQDLVFGSPSTAALSYLSPDTEWTGRTQVASLRAGWKATARLTLTAEGTWVAGRERYDPNFSRDADLEDLSRAEFDTLAASLKADVALARGLDLSLTGVWAQYDDKRYDDQDGEAAGVLVAVQMKW